MLSEFFTRFKIVILLLCITFLISCTEDSALVNFKEETVKLLHADPVSDLEQAIRKSDFRFKGVSGNKSYIPFASECMQAKFGVSMIRNTNEVLVGYHQQTYQAVSNVYAEIYNLSLTAYLNESKAIDVCDESQ